VITNALKKFKNNEYYPTNVEPVEIRIVELYNLTELSK
jgi:hypothetical protein